MNIHITIVIFWHFVEMTEKERRQERGKLCKEEEYGKEEEAEVFKLNLKEEEQREWQAVLTTKHWYRPMAN